METVTLTTKDGVDLEALLWDAGSSKSALLLHMMPATKESWVELAEQLHAQGFNVLAPDLRGHGSSAGGDYKAFQDSDHQKYIRDVEAAVEFLEAKYPETSMVMAGASIGANTMLLYMSEHLHVQAGVALSAGLNYHGVDAAHAVTKLVPQQRVLFVGSRDDLRGGALDCGAQAEELYNRAAATKEFLVYDTGGHGTDMLTAHPELFEKILNFFKE